MPILLSQGQAHYLEGGLCPLGYSPQHAFARTIAAFHRTSACFVFRRLAGLMPSVVNKDKETLLLDVVNQAAGDIAQLEKCCIANKDAWLDDIAMLSVGWVRYEFCKY